MRPEQEQRARVKRAADPGTVLGESWGLAPIVAELPSSHRSRENRQLCKKCKLPHRPNPRTALQGPAPCPSLAEADGGGSQQNGRPSVSGLTAS